MYLKLCEIRFDKLKFDTLKIGQKAVRPSFALNYMKNYDKRNYTIPARISQMQVLCLCKCFKNF